jgi:hypothetical protein
MKKSALLSVTVALLLALTAGVAVARDFSSEATNGDDVISGTESADFIPGKGGSDRLYGRGAGDTIKGGFGNDPALKGAEGNDSINGNLGNDHLYGGPGNDTLNGGQGRDLLEGQGGNDRVFASGDSTRDTVKCGNGDDYAKVDLNDVVDGELVSSLGEAPGSVIAILSCETVKIDPLPPLSIGL